MAKMPDAETIQIIKQAFWLTFHKEGEIWFDYRLDEDRNEAITQSYFDTFMTNLEKVCGEQNG